ncbi:hypothetical protein EYZ11_002169 [Aspergillus tanneri]|uniref:Uncharacterized protein n=1 Tax=Aspergillus tanneri TaxID=1220188 RepID=A0A4S3JTC2_9EURO|nr:uncharacterized protein ATNIH1004_010842 [Aspergillus tanneri]KAA8641903.1 hypothetical protein ATNIH1004_010842 [Aspergillus tanneri]THC98388.1 hypothetical protein EYZ11_002169 [Aspergillus tanneri]
MVRQLPTCGVKREREDPEGDESPGRGSKSAMNTVNPTDLFNLGKNLKLLPVPETTDDLEVTCKKMQDLAKVVEEGNSLALYTGLKLASQQSRNPELIARTQLAPREREEYERWREMKDNRNRNSDGNNEDNQYNNIIMKLPDFDWDKNVAPVPQGSRSLKKFKQRAEAMAQIWDHQGVKPEHASWLTFNMTALLPLVKAVTKISNIERHLEEQNPGICNRTDMEFAELETARNILAVAERNRAREMARIRKLMKSITESTTIMKTRIRALEK